MRDIKFIITKDGKHFSSEYSDHYIIARDNGYDVRDIIECGLFAGGKMFVLECQEPKHREKLTHTDKYILNDVNRYLADLTAYRVQKARECESRAQYSYAGLKEGD